MSIEELQAENARLKIEADLLEGRVRYWRIEAECDHGRWLRCLEDLEKLRAMSFVTAVPCEHYERVVKAGDGLYKSMLEIGCNEMADNFQYDAWWGSMNDWNAAKEGKPSV